MGRPPCCHKANVKSGLWSPEEDTTLKNFVQTHGYVGNWATLPHKAGLNRCGKSCRLRWLNYLRPDIKHGGFTHEEDNIICHLFKKMGSRWSFIASQLPGRTDNDVKNYWNTKLKKKCLINNTIHLPSQVSQTKPEQQNYFYSFSSTMGSDPSLNDQIPSPPASSGAGLSPIHVPTPGVLPIKPTLEIGSSAVNVNITTSNIDSLSNQDQISADPSSAASSLNNNNNISWSGGDENFDSFLMQDFGFDDELLNNSHNDNNISWTGGNEESDSFLMQDFGFDDELLNIFDFQDK